MTTKLKSVELPLDEDIQQAVLSIPLIAGDGIPHTIGSLLKRASDDLLRVNEILQTNQLVRLTAAHIMRTGKKRGSAAMVAKLRGVVCLQVEYEGRSEQNTPHLTRKKSLPSLSLLRKKADESGIDVSDLGRHKRKIMERLNIKRIELE